MYQIRNEQPGERAAILALHELALGPGRYALSAYRLREGCEPLATLSHVAVSEDQILGSIRFSPIWVGLQEALLLGPLAVDPERHGTGIGLDLLRAGIDACGKNKHRAIVLVGDEPYYGRVGFQRLSTGQVTFPGPVDPNRLLGLSLSEDPLDKLCGPATSRLK